MVLKETEVMTNQHSDKLFAGSIPEIYEKYLVPLIFEYYAQDLAKRVREKPVSRVLEIAAGTGVVTRAIADILDENVSIIATDLNKAMLDHGASVRVDKNVEWREADAMALPFEAESFDAVLCQFAVMFFPDRKRICRHCNCFSGECFSRKSAAIPGKGTARILEHRQDQIGT
jgi:ubiquinone/menaquinone biosynthesis C-methylase UbiE